MGSSGCQFDGGVRLSDNDKYEKFELLSKLVVGIAKENGILFPLSFFTRNHPFREVNMILLHWIKNNGRIHFDPLDNSWLNLAGFQQEMIDDSFRIGESAQIIKPKKKLL